MERLPVQVGMLHDSAADARSAITGSVALVYCPRCAMVHNRRFEPDKMTLQPGYEVQLVHSPMFREFLHEVAERLIRRYHLRGKNIVDVGCGAGHFLQLLCERGGNLGVGIDPTLPASRRITLSPGEMQLIRDCFGEKYAACDFDFVVSQSVLENVAAPMSFLRSIRKMLLRTRGQAYFEVFNAYRAFEDGETWSLCYEQCNYYSLRSFTEMIRSAGFQILDAAGCYGQNQYIYVEARVNNSRPAVINGEACFELPTPLAKYSSVHAAKVSNWWKRIDQYRAERKRVAVWGSGGKSICFLNTIHAPDVFRFVIDVNPARQGKFMPGSGQPILSPNYLNKDRPEVVIVTNPLYEQEIRAIVNGMGLECSYVAI
jgi:SAM-dependent methyltransferase